jgi:hypothetical protein
MTTREERRQKEEERRRVLEAQAAMDPGTWPLRLGLEYGDPALLCAAMEEYILPNGNVWAKPCHYEIYGENLDELRSRLADHMRTWPHVSP